jgi:PAS domain S-box-containing protein
MPEWPVEALLAAIVESSDDAIVGKTLDGTIVSWNGGAARMFGYSADEVIGKSITLIIPPERIDEEDTILTKLRRGERIDHFDTVRVTKDGRRLEISLSVSPIRDERGRIVGASKIARDITMRKRAEEALRDADQQKDAFIALISHELRNPLAPIQYALSTIKNAESTPEQEERAQAIIERQFKVMSRLLDDLLDLARIRSGKLELKKSRTSLRAVVQTAVETAKPLVEAKQQELAVDLPVCDVHLEADSVRLGQALSNMLINAAKYTHVGGRITFGAYQDGSDLVVSVVDNGIGFSSEFASTLFDMFSQAPAAVSRAQGGLGIGLAVVRGIVTLHGGTVEARSAGAGRGSQFIVRLPI